ncbi:unnamed protein product [Caenorhabditis bovis]|uniref:Innexin n=1 Tax=Caenorhabditis bovis TaxID=2654633 RepID=A0A8S1F6Q6_9PELO|nr:unnamed protein product [Caenorhabditis bovis]
MEQLIDLFQQYNTPRYEDDFVDRLNFQYTSYFFAFSTLVISYNTYFGTAISCWAPAEFRRGWIEYTRDYCLIENTYYLPLNDPNMPPQEEREQRKLPYYQWVQFFLILLAVLFFIPHLIWRTVNWWSGLHVRAVVKAACQLDKTNDKKRREEIVKIAQHIHRFSERQKSGLLSIGFFPRSITYRWVSLNYILLKSLFLVNILFQLVLIVRFLGVPTWSLFNFTPLFGSDWVSNGIFPRQTMCDFEIRKKGAIQKYSVQCVLSMNMLNEKIFIILFYWLMILAITTLFNIFSSVAAIWGTNSIRDFTTRMLRASGVSTSSAANEKEPLLPPSQLHISDKFLDLSEDVATVLRLISKNAGVNVCSDVIGELYLLNANKSN